MAVKTEKRFAVFDSQDVIGRRKNEFNMFL